MNRDGALLAIDQGTNSSRTIASSPTGAVLETAQQPFEPIYLRSDWVEHDSELIWSTALVTVRAVLRRLAERDIQVIAVGITNQRETTVAWNRRTGAPLCNAIVWQDRRTADICRRLADVGEQESLAQQTGLRRDSCFS